MNEDQELAALNELEAELKALEEFIETSPAPEPEVVKAPKSKPAKAKAQKKEAPKPASAPAPEVRLYGADRLRAKRGR